MPSSPAINLSQAKNILRFGGILVYPTETFFAVGCRSDAPEAVALIGALKCRLPEKPFPLIVPDLARAERIADFGELHRRVAENFWPGPLTMLLRARGYLDPRLKNGQNKVALRVPASTVARGLAEACGVPIISTSANFSGSPPAATFGELNLKFLENLRRIGGAVLRESGEEKRFKLPSTIVGFEESAAKILRDGAISRSSLEAKGIPIIDPEKL